MTDAEIMAGFQRVIDGFAKVREGFDAINAYNQAQDKRLASLETLLSVSPDTTTQAGMEIAKLRVGELYVGGKKLTIGGKVDDL